MLRMQTCGATVINYYLVAVGDAKFSNKATGIEIKIVIVRGKSESICCFKLILIKIAMNRTESCISRAVN